MRKKQLFLLSPPFYELYILNNLLLIITITSVSWYEIVCDRGYTMIPDDPFFAGME